MPIEPNEGNYGRIIEEAKSSGEFDMEVFNHLFKDSTTVLPHRRLTLLTGKLSAVQTMSGIWQKIRMRSAMPWLKSLRRTSFSLATGRCLNPCVLILIRSGLLRFLLVRTMMWRLLTGQSVRIGSCGLGFVRIVIGIRK
jgi:hypothetical protein